MWQGSEFGCLHSSSPTPASHSHSFWVWGWEQGVFPSEEPSPFSLVVGQVGWPRAVEAFSAKTSKPTGTLL